MSLPILTRETLTKHTATVPLHLPDPAVFDLPERVLQFGTGVLLRALCDGFFDEANQQGRFNGRVVVVKSTDQGDGAASTADTFGRQEGLFTHIIRGLDNGEPMEEYRVNASISRTLSARSQWADVLACAQNPDLQLVVSNTTEVGIQLDETEDLSAAPPASFPGKLTRFLYERWQAFGGSADAGLVIVPTELIPDNGTKLQEICLELAHRGGLEVAFLDWLETANQFCNSLVDRIVPGKPNAADLADAEQKLGYRDGLLLVSEAYRLWAIEGDERVKAAFDALDVCPPGLIIAPDIEIYRELKLRLLNGTHTLTCGLGFLCGKNAVREGMDDPALGNFVERLMLDELAPAIPYDVSEEAAETFGRQVLDRFRNPFIEHKLLSITVQYTAKMRMRNVPLLLTHYERQGYAPERFALGFAAYLLFMKSVGEDTGQYFGRRGGQPYPIQDEAAAWFGAWWQRGSDVAEVLAHAPFWGQDLNALPGFTERVTECLVALQKRGAAAVLAESEVMLVKS